MSKLTEYRDAGNKYKKLGIIGFQLYLNEFGIGIVEGYNGEKNIPARFHSLKTVQRWQDGKLMC